MWNLDALIEILAAFAGTIGYGALFNVRGKKLLFAVLAVWAVGLFSYFSTALLKMR